LRQIDERFGQAFSKACAVEAAEASSPSADGEISSSAFSFYSFSFAPAICKRKTAKEFAQSNKLYAFGLQRAGVPVFAGTPAH
jgi:hypothetical protein